MSSSLTAGVVGLGDIGQGVATNVERAGIALTVFDVQDAACAKYAGVARIASDPADLATTADVILLAVVNDSQVMEVLGGSNSLLDGARAGSVVVVLSTVSPQTVQEAAALASSRDLAILDCGVSGGPVAAAEGSLVGMLGGELETIDRVRPVLDAFCALVVHMGPLGAGLKAKLARNLVQYASWLAAYEGQVLAEAAGIELAKLAEVIRASDEKIGGASRLMFRRSVAPFGADEDKGIVQAMSAAAGLAHKDLRAALALAKELGVHLPMAEMTDARTDAIFGIGPDDSQT